MTFGGCETLVRERCEGQIPHHCSVRIKQRAPSSRWVRLNAVQVRTDVDTLRRGSILVFDLGGVLLPFDQERRVRAMVKALGMARADVVGFLRSGVAEEMDCGRCVLQTSAGKMSAFAGRTISAVQAKALWLSVFEMPNVALWDMVARLRARTRTYALSDNPGFVQDVFPRADAFERVFWSSELG